MAILTVGRSEQYSSIQAAVSASRSGDTIDVFPGTYNNNFAIISHNVTIQGVNASGHVSSRPLAHLTATVGPPNDKGMFTAGTVGDAPSVRITGLEISGVAIPVRLGDNGAAVRYQSGNLTLADDYFHNNQEGLLATPLVAGTGDLRISGSEFAYNGANGYEHSIYVGTVQSLTVTDSYFHDTIKGHEIKSRAENNTISNDRIYTDGAGPNDTSGTDSMQIDLPNGGRDIVTRDVIEKGLRAENQRFIGFGEVAGLDGAPLWANSSLLVQDDTFVNDHGTNTTAIWDASGLDGAVTASDDSFWGMPAVAGPGNVELTLRPVLDYAHPWQTGSGDP
jgi:hypothetical protein